jgi:hypothetical protein
VNEINTLRREPAPLLRRYNPYITIEYRDLV